jgi:pimeloyl-ACP methyl ester carboxylesterase
MKAQEQRFYYNDSDYITFIKKGNGSTSLVYLHGFGASKNSWDDFYTLFDSSIYTSYLIDLKGFGNSSIPKDKKYSLNENKKILTKFIDSIITQKYFLFGHSYGGGVSLLLVTSKKLRNKPKLLILMDCAAYNIDTPFFIKYLQNPFISNILYLFSTPKIRAKFTLNRIVNEKNYTNKILNRYIESFKGVRKKYSFVQSAKQIAPENYEQLIAEYSKIKMPTLIIWGKQDKILSVKQGELLSQQIENSELKMIDICGHIPQEEKPDTTFKIVESFINNQKQ